MQIKIKDFYIDMEVKTRGIEFEVRSPNGDEHHGDCKLTKTKLEWLKGRSQSGTELTWEDFMAIMKSEKTMKAAVEAAKEASVSD